MNWALLRKRIKGALSVSECEVLADLASHTKATRALEVGHYLGLSTTVLLTSLPKACELVTIDHHEGDDWSGVSSAMQFTENIAPYVKGRTYRAITDDMSVALPTLEPAFGFVFYDADHSLQAVKRFWKLALPLLTDECTLIFDDADWEEQGALFGLAEAAGFVSVRSRFFWRGEDDKKDPETYTLEVMIR